MNSRLTEDFLACYARLPASIRAQARRAYRLWRADPSHPGVHFKRVHATEPVDSARVGLGWRALGLLEGGTVPGSRSALMPSTMRYLPGCNA